MKTQHFFYRAFLFLIVFSLPAACQASTPEAISTPILTTTSKTASAPTPTDTPLSLLTVKPCPYTSLCPQAVIIEDFIPGKFEPGKVYNVDVPYNQPVSFYTIWIAKDFTILAQNLESMQFFVKIDGQNYWEDSFKGELEPYESQKEPGTEYASQWAGLVISGWKIGQTHEIRIGYTITGQINDGWDSFTSGTVIEDIYVVNPILSSGITSTATLAPTPALDRTLSESLICQIDPLTWLGIESLKVSPDNKRVAYAAQVGNQSFFIVDGVEQQPYIGVGTASLVFSPDNQRVAYVAQVDNQQIVVLDGSEQPQYDSIGAGSLIFSPDSKRVAYAALMDNKIIIVVDQKEGRQFETFGIGSLIFSPDSQHVAYVAGVGKKQFVVVDGSEQQYEDISKGSLIFSPDSQHVAYVAIDIDGNQQFLVMDGQEGKHYETIDLLVFSPDSQHLAYAAEVGDKWVVVVDGIEQQQQYDNLGTASLVFSPDSQRVAYVAGVGSQDFVVVDGQEGKHYNGIGEGGLVFSPDSQRVIYMAGIGNQWVAVVDGIEGKQYVGIGKGTFTFSPDSQHVAYMAGIGDQQVVVMDGIEGKSYDGIGPITFSPDSQRVAYVAVVGNQQFVVINGNEGKQYNAVISLVRDKTIVFESPDSLRYLGMLGNSIYFVEEKIK